MLKSVKIDKAKREVSIILDLDTPTESKSGKTLVLASTRGNAVSGERYDGKPVVVGVNAYVPVQ